MILNRALMFNILLEKKIYYTNLFTHRKKILSYDKSGKINLRLVSRSKRISSIDVSYDKDTERMKMSLNNNKISCVLHIPDYYMKYAENELEFSEILPRIVEFRSNYEGNFKFEHIGDFGEYLIDNNLCYFNTIFLSLFDISYAAIQTSCIYQSLNINT